MRKLKIPYNSIFVVIIKFLFSVVAYAIAICNYVFDIETTLLPKIIICICDVYLSQFIVCAIHELSHFLFFMVNRNIVTLVRVGIFGVMYKNGKVEFKVENASLFSGCCIAKKNTSCYGTIVALYAGGISGILIAAFFLFRVVALFPTISFLELCIGVIGGLSGTFSVFYPKSADRKQILEIGRTRVR